MKFQGKPKKYLIIVLKVIGWISLSLFGLLVLIALAVQIPFVQNKLVQKAVSFLESKIGTEVSLDHISLSLPKSIVLNGLYLQDQRKDTLLYAGELSVNTDLWKLTRQTIQLNNIELSDFTGSVQRSQRDSSFNFDYIIEAFAGDSAVAPDTTQAPWKFSVGDIALNDIRLSFDDRLMGNDITVTLGALKIGMEELDLENSIIKIDEIDLENVRANLVQSKVAVDTVTVVPDTINQPISFDIGVNAVMFQNIQALYNHQGTGQVINLNLGELVMEGEGIDLQNHTIDLRKFSLKNTFASYHQMAGFQKNEAKEKTQPSNPPDDPWHFTLDELDLSNNSIQYHDFNQPFQREQFDPDHIWITNLTTEAENIKLAGSDITGELAAFSFKDRSGVSVESLSTNIALNDTSLKVDNLELISRHSRLQLTVKATYPSLKTISDTYPDAFIDLSIENSTIGVEDIRLFAPSVFDSLPITIPTATEVSVDAGLTGPLKNLTVRHLNIATLEETLLDAKGTIQLSQRDDPYVALKLNKFYTTAKDVRAIVPDTLIPAAIALPEWLNITGSLKGTMQSPAVNSTLTSNLGEIKINAELTRTRESGVSSYKASLNVNKFQTGKLLKQEKVFGPISLTADVDGSGLSMEELNTKVNLKILSFIYQKYEYKNFTLDGSLKKYFFSGLAVLPDENLDVRLKGDLDYNESVPRYRFTLELKNADFKALNFSERPLKARGTIDVDLATSDFRLINGDLAIRKFAVFNGKDMYAVDSLLFASIDQEGQSEIKVQSDIVDANFKGTINLYSLPEVIKRHFNQYFSMHDTAFDKPADAQDFKFDLKIKNTDLLTEILIPDLDPFIPGEIMGEFDSKAHRMDLRIGLAKMGYAGVKADSISFDVMSDRERLGYTLAVRKISRDTIRMEALKLEGNVANDSIRTKLVILDSLQKDKYVLGGVFHSLEKVFQFRFLENEVIMNYAPWTTPPDNSLQFTSKGMLAHNFSITNINEMIALKTSNDADSIVSIVFKDLNLQNITKLVEGATPIDGLANGDLNMMSSESGAFTTSLTIADLNILDHPWGDLSLALGQTSSGPLNIDLRLESDGTSLKAAGYYTSKVASPKINFVTEITKFDLASIEPLTLGQLKNTKGQLKGEVRITGDAKQPDINGTLNFTDASFTPSTINTEFILEDETITIKDRQMLLSNFEIKDQENNLAKIEGDISWTESQDFDLNLDLNATNFQVLNSTEKDNELFYGKVRLSTKAKITGNLNQPVIDMNINLSDESNFTYVIPQSEKGVLEQQGIVVFVDRDAKDDPFLAGIDPRDTIKSTFRGIDLSANIELNDKETFNIIIDPLTGDKLSVKGNSTLTLDMDPTGDMFLSGRYEISEGSYDLSFYKFVKRKFLIEKGSTITWSGSPTDADMNIRAINEVETAPIDLFVTGDDSDEQLNMYKQRLNFLVYLIIKGQMLSPEISFELDMPEDERNAMGGVVYGKIRDINTRESELNKQVFALLVLRRFISDDPLNSEAGSDLESTARQSVSRLLSEQLNRLSENVEGVELSFDVKSYEDYSTGSGEGQTELQLGLSKSLLDDRLVVKVAGNLEVEGDTQNSATDYIGDLGLEYKLTEDGRFRITGFRQSNYDMLDGVVIETGMGLIYIKDYNTFRELFKANAKE
jgi:translocation and assembly module TamB